MWTIFALHHPNTVNTTWRDCFVIKEHRSTISSVVLLQTFQCKSFRLTFSFLVGGVPGLFFQPYRKPKRIRTAFSPSQLLQLEKSFEKSHYVVGQERKDLANELQLTETQVCRLNSHSSVFGDHRKGFVAVLSYASAWLCSAGFMLIPLKKWHV